MRSIPTEYKKEYIEYCRLLANAIQIELKADHKLQLFYSKESAKLPNTVTVYRNLALEYSFDVKISQT